MGVVDVWRPVVFKALFDHLAYGVPRVNIINNSREVGNLLGLPSPKADYSDWLLPISTIKKGLSNKQREAISPPRVWANRDSNPGPLSQISTIRVLFH